MSSRYRFGAHTLDTARACLLLDGHEVPLRPKSFALLEYLVVNAGRLVTKEELLAALWPGLVVTDDSLTRCISEVRAALGDGAQRHIKTLPRRGYRFDAPVTQVAAADAVDALDAPNPPVSVTTPTPTPPPVRSVGPGRWAAGAAFAAALIAAVAWTAWTQPPAPRLTLVVLPFADTSASAGRGYLADNLTEELAIALSRLRGASVIASASAFSYRRQPIDTHQIGIDLGVRYVVQGSVFDAGERLRINTRLIDAQSGRMMWSDQVDVARAELPKAQDEIVLRLVNALDGELVQADVRRAVLAAPSSLDAEDLAMQCDAASAHRQGESGGPSYALCERALQLDPTNVRALVRLALYYGDRVERKQSPDPAGDLAQARAWVARALEVAPNDFAAHCANAIVLGGEHKVRDAIIAAQRCQTLNPNHARAYRILATQYFFLAEPEQTLKWVERGMRLSPRDPSMAAFLLFRGWAHLMLQQDDQALVWLRQADAASPDSPSILAPLTSVLALTGHDAEARATLARYLANKRTHARTIAQWQDNADPNADFERFAKRFKSGLRQAGMAEG